MKNMILIISIISISFILGCSMNSTNETPRTQAPLIFDDEYTTFTFYNSKEVKLFSINYRMENNSKQTLGPFYVKYIFHNDTLVNNLKNNQKEYVSYHRFKDENSLIKLLPGEIYQGGDNFDTISEPLQTDALEEIIKQHNALEIQMIELATNKVLASYWVHHFLFVNE